MTTNASLISGVSSALTVKGNVALLAPLAITTTPALAPMSAMLAPGLVALGLIAQVMVAAPNEPLRTTVKSTVDVPLSGSVVCT